MLVFAPTMHYPKWIFGLLPVLVLLHWNVWMWESDRTIWGWPANLLYHAVLSVAWSFVMWTVVRRAWPSYLDD